MDRFNALLQASLTLFANLSPQFFHSDHGKAVANEIQAGLTAAAIAGVLAENAKAQQGAGMTTVNLTGSK